MVLKKQSKKITLNINGISVDCSISDSVLDAIKKSGFDVPTLCYDERTGPRGSCRMCLVQVETDTNNEIVASCTAAASDGMNIQTHSNPMKEYRRNLLELILSETGPMNDCPKCNSTGQCEFHRATTDY